jgi:uracil DNA glycosylase
MAALDELLNLMENLQVVVLVGRKAARARSHLEGRGIPVLQSPHPSPIVRASRPSTWQSIPETWAAALPILRSRR